MNRKAPLRAAKHAASKFKDATSGRSRSGTAADTAQHRPERIVRPALTVSWAQPRRVAVMDAAIAVRMAAVSQDLMACFRDCIIGVSGCWTPQPLTVEIW